MLMSSLKRHIESIWLSDMYDSNLVQTRTGFCPSELEELLTYTDKNGVDRIFGPCVVRLGRQQADALNLSNNDAVPSAYIEITANDYEEIEAWRDSIWQREGGAKPLGREHMFEIGGAHQMVRRFTVKMVTYYLESDQEIDEVNRLGHAARSFLESICTASWEMDKSWCWPMEDESGDRIVDAFNERVWSAHAVMSHSRIRGGPESDYIFDIKLYVEVNTEKS